MGGRWPSDLCEHGARPTYSVCPRPLMHPHTSGAHTFSRYISDIAAFGLKPFFIAGCAVTAVFFDLAFISERYLRHSSRLLRNKGRLDKAFSILAVIFSIMGGIGLILLSIFDTYRHSHQHGGFLVLFMYGHSLFCLFLFFRIDRKCHELTVYRGGYLLSAIFVCLEYLRLGLHYRDHIILTISFWVKLAFIVVELALSIAFGVTGRGHRKNQAAVLEWIIAYIFTFYMLSYVVDLLPAVRTRRHIPQGERRPEMMQTAYTAGQPPPPTSGGGEGDMWEEPLTTDSMGEAANTYRGRVTDGGGGSAYWPGTAPNGYTPRGTADGGNYGPGRGQGRFKEQTEGVV